MWVLGGIILGIQAQNNTVHTSKIIQTVQHLSHTKPGL